MTKEQRRLFGVTDDDWKAAKHRTAEAIVGGRATYHSRSDKQHLNGKRATIVRVLRSKREIELKWDDTGTNFRAFAHNVTLG